MLATILKPDGLADQDLLIFLENKEIENLENELLKGEIFEFQNVKKVYPLEILVAMGKGYQGGVRVSQKDNKYKVEIDNYYYQKLKENSLLGTRAGAHFKIDIMAKDYAMQNEEFSRDLRSIKNKWENRDKIIQKISRDGV